MGATITIVVGELLEPSKDLLKYRDDIWPVYGGGQYVVRTTDVIYDSGYYSAKGVRNRHKGIKTALVQFKPEPNYSRFISYSTEGNAYLWYNPFGKQFEIRASRNIGVSEVISLNIPKAPERKTCLKYTTVSNRYTASEEELMATHLEVIGKWKAILEMPVDSIVA